MERCAYCKRVIPQNHLIDKYVLGWNIRKLKNEDGQKLFTEKTPRERVCRNCYFNEVKTNVISNKR